MSRRPQPLHRRVPPPKLQCELHAAELLVQVIEPGYGLSICRCIFSFNRTDQSGKVRHSKQYWTKSEKKLEGVSLKTQATLYTQTQLNQTQTKRPKRKTHATQTPNIHTTYTKYTYIHN